MLSLFNDFTNLCKNSHIEMTNDNFNYIVNEFHYFFITQNNSLNQINEINTESTIMIIDQYTESNNTYLLFCFDRNLLIISVNNLDLIKPFINKNSRSIAIPLTNSAKETICDHFHSKPIFSHFYEFDETDFEEIEILAKSMQILNQEVIKFWRIIRRIIAACLLSQCHQKPSYNRISRFVQSENKLIELNKRDYIKLREIGIGSSSVVYLIYHIVKQKLYALKVFLGNEINNEATELFQREMKFYSNLKHPFLSNYYGTTMVESKNCLILEYIDGCQLDSIERLKLTFSEKIKIIFQILILIEFLHQNKLIYRDIKPDNFIIDLNMTVVLIDRDRMAEKLNQNVCGELTQNLFHIYLAPEIQSSSEFSYEADIYSLGLLIYFIFVEKQPEIKYDNNFNPILTSLDQFPDRFIELKNVCKSCMNINPLKRPKLSEIIDLVYINYFTKFPINETNTIITTKNIHSIKYVEFWYFLSESYLNISQYNLGIMFEEGNLFKLDIKKTIQYYSLASNKNNYLAQFRLGNIYREGRYVMGDIDKAIYYYSLAAKNKYLYAIYFLGNIYYTKNDIDRSIHYYEIAANKFNFFKAQIYLGRIYLDGIKCKRNIDKSIYYFTLAANNNDNAEALHYLGFIYTINRPNKELSIYYFTRAANQNYTLSQYILGVIYLNNTFVERNIEKSIYYFEKAADSGFPEAQVSLASIFWKGNYVKRDWDKAFYYFNKAAKNNNSMGQFMVGIIYMFYKKEINVKESLCYLKLSAEKNHPEALLYLAEIYRQGINVKVDIDLALHYYRKSADICNFDKAQFYLGYLYLEGRIVEQDINLSIKYLKLSANNNFFLAQYALARLYYNNKMIPRNINFSLHYYHLSCQNKCIKSFFELAFIYTEGKYVKRDISKAIYYYKEASSYDDQYSKNNLGVIYQIGFETPINYSYSIELYKEAIKKRNDAVSMYNLAILYLNQNYFRCNLVECLSLLLKSAVNGFEPSKKFLISFFSIMSLLDYNDDNDKQVFDEIRQFIATLNLDQTNLIILNEKFEFYQDLKLLYAIKNEIFFYDINKNYISSDVVIHNADKFNSSSQRKKLTDEFYKGFGLM